MVLPVYEDEFGYLSKQRRAFSFVEGTTSCVNFELKNLSKVVGGGGGRVMESSPPSPEDKIPHKGRVNDVFACMRYVLLILGRFPFIPTIPTDQFSKKDHGETRIGGDGRIGDENFGGQSSRNGLNYSSSVKSLSWIYFGTTSIFLLILLALSVFSFLGVFLSWSFFSLPPWTTEQDKLFQSNLIPFVLVWSCLLSSTVGNISFLLNRKNVVKFLNFWNVAVDKMDMKVPNHLKRFLHMNNLWFLFFAVLMVVSTYVLTIQLAQGGSSLMGVLVLRILIPNVDQDYEWICRSFGMVIILYAMYASRSLLFFFVFKCKILRYCIKVWNSRLREELQGSPIQEIDEDTNCRKLFYDHVILLKLVRLTDKVFAAILLSYFGSQILNMCFELYYVAMSNTFTIFNSHGDGLDTFVAIVLLIQNIYVFLSVSLHAAYVSEEANKSYEIIKTKGISVHDSVARRHLILSLQMSFHQRMCLTGGHYFVVDKPFIVTVLGAVVTYFIIILQYGNQYQSEGHSLQYSMNESH